MKRSELIESREYWIANIQLHLFEIIKEYLEANQLTQNQFAEKIGFTKGYVSQILNGDFDHKISKLVDLSLAVGKVPKITFQDISEFMGDEICGFFQPYSKVSDIATQDQNKSKRISMPSKYDNSYSTNEYFVKIQQNNI